MNGLTFNGPADNGPASPNTQLSNEMMKLYDAEFGGRKVMHLTDPEYHREVAIGKAPDTFPCGHVLCHRCIRKHLKPSRETVLSCPICGHEATRIYTADPSASLGYSTDDVDTTISLLANFDDMVERFNGINHNLRRLKEESVKSRSLAMTFSNCACHMCEENHGTLHVIQECNRLQVLHKRPAMLSPYFYRLSQGKVVTTFYSEVNSSSICVPCTYKQLCLSRKFPDLKALNADDILEHPGSVLSQVGKIIAKRGAPLDSLQGKNVMDIDHTIQIQEPAHEFDFGQTSAQIKNMVNQQEQIMMTVASCRIQDKGGVYHIQESSSMEQNKGETAIW